MKVSEASATYGVGSKAIYRWLREGVVDGNRNFILENNKLKKELEIAYRIFGRLTAETQHQTSPPTSSDLQLHVRAICRLFVPNRSVWLRFEPEKLPAYP